MQIESKGVKLWENLAVPCGNKLIRSSIYIAPCVYLVANAGSLSDRELYVIAAIYGTPAVVYLTGSLEALTRSIVYLSAGFFGSHEEKPTRYQFAFLELDTAQRLMRNAISPLSGWPAIINDGRAFYKDSTNKRILFKEYYSYQIIYHVGFQPYRLIKFLNKNILIPGLNKTIDLSIKTNQFVVDSLDTIGVWKCIGSIADWSVKMLESSVNYALSSFKG